MKTTLTFIEGKSAKFYTLEVSKNVLTINFGRVGSNGQTKVTRYKTDAGAKKEFEALLAAKKKKGYVGEGGAPPEAPEEAAAALTAAVAEEIVPKKTKGEGKPSAKAADSKAEAAAAVAEGGVPDNGRAKPKTKASGADGDAAVLARAAMADPEVPGLNLTVWRAGPVPVPEKDSTPFPEGDFQIDGYSLSFADDDSVVVTDPKGKTLKSVPDKLRKCEEYQALMRGRKDDRARVGRARRLLEERLIAGVPFSSAEIAWLVDDDAFAPMLKGLVVYPEGRAENAGLVLSWDKKRGLGVLPLDYDARWIGWQDVELAHPMKLGDVTPWQDLLIDLNLQQTLVQVFREIRNVPGSQRNSSESSMLAGRETKAASTIERTLMADGWSVRRGMARRKLSVRRDGGVGTVEAWFDYGEFYMPADPTTTGSFGFYEPGSTKGIKFKDVPEVLLSEAVRSLEMCLAQAGVKKAEASDEEGDEATREGEEAEDKEDEDESED